MHRDRPVRRKCCGRSLFALSLAAALLDALPPSPIPAGTCPAAFTGGFAHPLFGPDHVVAMVAVGLWGAFLGRAGDLAPADRVPAGDGGRRRASAFWACRCRRRNRHRDVGVVLGLMVALAAQSRRSGLLRCWSERLRSSTAHAHGAELAAREPTRSPIRSASWWRPASCISPASPSVFWRAGRPDGSQCVLRAAPSRLRASHS